MILQHFYESLGEFLYALALCDGKITERETKAVTSIISHEIKRIKSSKTHPELKEILLTTMSFKNCVSKQLSVKKASATFIEFLKSNSIHVERNHKVIAMRLINSVIKAYKGECAHELFLKKEVEKYLL